MKLTFLGKGGSLGGSCPSVYRTDRGTYVIQGYLLTDPEARAELRDVLAGEEAVEVPAELIELIKGL